MRGGTRWQWPHHGGRGSPRRGVKQLPEECRTQGKQPIRRPSKPPVLTTIQKEEQNSDSLQRAGNGGNVCLPFSGKKNRDHVTAYHVLA